MKDNSKMKKLLDKLTEDFILSDVENAEIYLEANGYDMKEISEIVNMQIKKIHFLINAKRKKEKDSLLFNRALEQIKKQSKDNFSKTKDVLMEIIKKKNLSFQFRSLEEWNEEQIREIIEDIDIIELLEKLDNE